MSQQLEQMRTILEAGIWKEDVKAALAEDFVIDFSYAPPGMTQYYGKFEQLFLFHWLNRTVKSFALHITEAEEMEPEGISLFRGTLSAEVIWGEEPSAYESRFLFLCTMEAEKMSKLVVAINPVKMIEAAGLMAPKFPLHWHHPDVEAAMEEFKKIPPVTMPEQVDLSPEAIEARKQSNVVIYDGSVPYEEALANAQEHPAKEHHVWFMPKGFMDEFPPEIVPRIASWSMVSYHDLHFQNLADVIWSKDHSRCVIKCACWGEADWPDVPFVSDYYNYYWFYLRFDEAGWLIEDTEIMNPIPMYNAAKVTLPSFPYGFYKRGNK